MEDLSTIIKSGGSIINKVMTVNDAAIGTYKLSIKTYYLKNPIDQESVWETVSEAESYWAISHILKIYWF